LLFETNNKKFSLKRVKEEEDLRTSRMKSVTERKGGQSYED